VHIRNDQLLDIGLPKIINYPNCPVFGRHGRRCSTGTLNEQQPYVLVIRRPLRVGEEAQYVRELSRLALARI
jgi:hypothetical protein